MSDDLRPRRTHLSNRVYRLPGGTEDNDLWTRVTETEDGSPVICSTFVLTDEQRKRVAAGENVELIIWGNAQPPVALRLDDTPLGKKKSPPNQLQGERGSGERAELRVRAIDD